MNKLIALWLTLASAMVMAQNPQSQNAPIFSANAKYVNGVAPGYWPTPATGLTLNIGAGTANCSGTIITYAGGTLTMTASLTNYVYLNTAASCVPAIKTTAFTSTDIPIAIVITSGSAITSINDARTLFTAPPVVTAVNLSNGIVAGTGSGSSNHAASASDLAGITYAVASGSANAYVVTLSPAPSSLVTNMAVNFLPNAANTTTNPIINVNGLGAVTITKNGTSALVASDLTTTAIATLKYDGTHFQLQNPQTSSGGGGLPSGPALAVPAYLTAGTTATPLTLDADLSGYNGGILVSDGSRSLANGMFFVGDSKTQTATTGVPANTGYTTLVNRRINQGLYTNVAVGGDTASDQIFRVLTAVNPGDSGNPVYVTFIGTNDANNVGIVTNSQQAFLQYVVGANAWTSMSSTNKVFGNSVGAAIAAYSTTGGSAYAVGDTVTFTCGAVFTVMPPSSGTVSNLQLTTAGTGCVSANAVSPSATSGSGTGLVVTLIAQSTVTKIGGWSSDSTFTANPGLITTTNGDTIAYACPVGPSGYLNVWAYAFNAANSSTWGFTVDGVAQTDLLSGLSSIPSQILALPPAHVGTTVAVGALFGGIAEGSHTCVFTANVVGGGTVGFLAGGSPPANRSRNGDGPNSYMFGLDYQQNDAKSATTAAYNGYDILASKYVTGEGLENHFLDIRNAVDPYLDYNAVGPWPASLVPGLHGNMHWHIQAADLLIHAIKSGTPSPVQSNNTSLKMLPRLYTGATLPSTTWINEPCDFASINSYSCDNIANIDLTGTFGNVGGTTNSFSHLHIAPKAANQWAIYSFCYYDNTSGSPSYPGDTVIRALCPIQVYDGGIMVTKVGTKATSGTANSPSAVYRAKAEVNSGTNTWTDDDFDFFASPLTSGLNPEVDGVISNTVTTGTGVHCYFFGKTSAKIPTDGAKFCPTNASNFIVTHNNTNLTASRAQEDGDWSGTIGQGLSLSTGTATFAGGTGITSIACASGYLCNNTRGTLTIVGGTATTGTIATITFSAALAAAPWCAAKMNGGATFFGIGSSSPTTTAFNITAAVSVIGTTFNVDYECRP